jgi:uncharacterized membrane protein YfcA
MIPLETTLLAVLLTILFSSTVRATFGFADALIAMPILVVLLGAQTATPLVVLLPINIAIIIGHAGAGLWTSEVWILFLWSLPLVVLAIWGGNKLNKLIPPDKFTKYVYILLLIIGSGLALESFS